jgi:HAMP domain-containing protein
LEFLKKSVATKVGLVMGVMVLLTAIVMGGLFYLTTYEKFEEAKVKESTIRSQQIKVAFDKRMKEWSLFAEVLRRSDGESLDYIENLLLNFPSLLAWQKFTRQGNTLKLYPQSNTFRGLYSQNTPPLIFSLNENLNVRGVDELEDEHLGKKVFILEFLTPKFRYFLAVHNKLLSDEILLGLDKKDIFFVLGPKGRILSHRNPDKLGSYRTGVTYSIFEELPNFNFNDFKEHGFKEKTIFTLFRGEGHVFSFREIKLSDITLYAVAGSSISRRMNLKEFLNLKNLLVSLLLILGFTYLGWIFTRYLFRNLDEITEQAKKFTNGEHDMEIKVKSSDEIGILALTFQGMIRQVNERTRILRKSERRIREARDQAEKALSSKSHLLEDLRRQKAEVERISKDKDDLLAIVSHDLKNPLAVVETSMDIILEEEKNRMSPMGNDLVRRSKNSARIALNLITDLLDLSRLEGGIRLDFERFSVDEMVESVVDSFY